MAKQRHIIQRQILELTVHNGTNARQLQAEISRLYRQRIIPLIDRYCTALSDPDRIHRIESLEIDLGSLDPQRLEEEFVAKLDAALQQALAAQISQQEQQSNGRGPDLKSRSQLELFVFFARTGSLPWWTEAGRPRLLEECLVYLLQTTPESLRRSMRDLAGVQTALRRLAHHYSDDLLVRLAAVLVPPLASSLYGDLSFLVGLLQKSGTAANRPPVHLRALVWTNFLHVAGLAGAQHETAIPFYQAVLVRLAADLNTTVDTLLADLYRVVQQIEDAHLTGLKETIENLYRNSPATAVADTKAITRLKTALRAVAQRLPSSTREEVLAAIDRLKADEPIGKALRRILHLLDDELSPAEMSELTRLIAAENGPAALTLAEERALDLSFSEAEALYIRNAGLVILWPFLSHFFARMDLLEEKQFRDSAARQRAVGLLQHLATGELSFPEYLLPLNKILCGVELSEVFDFGPPLTETEAAECAALLAAVIGQAPILRDMSVSGLRGTFLLRPGALSSRDGAWLLRVERETYDVVLDRFPWGWEWVKLPWMEVPLRVEW